MVLLAGCWSSSKPAPTPVVAPEPAAPSSAFRSRPTKTRCQTTIESMVDKMRDELAHGGIPEATIDEMIDAAVESCRSMDWSSDLLACYDGAVDPQDIEKCSPLMTSEQTEDFTRRMMEIVSRMNATPPPPP